MATEYPGSFAVVNIHEAWAGNTFVPVGGTLPGTHLCSGWVDEQGSVERIGNDDGSGRRTCASVDIHYIKCVFAEAIDIDFACAGTTGDR